MSSYSMACKGLGLAVVHLGDTRGPGITRTSTGEETGPKDSINNSSLGTTFSTSSMAEPLRMKTSRSRLAFGEGFSICLSILLWS